MASSLYTLQTATVLCDVWQMECHTDNMADGISVTESSVISILVSMKGPLEKHLRKIAGPFHPFMTMLTSQVMITSLF